MQSGENRVIIACAGSGKTTLLVREALSRPDRRIAIVTYTNNNVREITKKFGEMNGGVPKHVEVMTWFTFLLRDGARPYQNALYAEKRIESLVFVSQQSTRGISEADTRRYYLANGEALYSDKIARFVVECENASGQLVTARLRQIYTDVFVDEFQDLAGWDLNLIEILLQSAIRITLVGDPRQHIYSTNPSPKNRRYLGADVVKLVREWQRKGLCQLETRDGTHRCNEAICRFASSLWPGMEGMVSLSQCQDEHAGVFVVPEDEVHGYVERFRPQILRHDKRSNTYGYPALNFGQAKGLEFNRVLIIPTEPIRRYLATAELVHIENSRDRLHVAVTRARHSVGFVLNCSSPVVPDRWPQLEPKGSNQDTAPIVESKHDREIDSDLWQGRLPSTGNGSHAG